MSWIPTKPLTEITLEDLEELIGVAESDRLEFKRDAYGTTREDRREMLRDITSFANARGGYLLLGIEEDDEDRATEIVGIPQAEEEGTRMLSCCLACIEARVLGLNFHTVPVGDGLQVLIWQIPRSTRAPHMIIFRGRQEFWRRHGRQKDQMTIEEIREACLRTESIRRSLEDFLAERRESVLAQIGGKPWLWLTATPLVVRGELVDIGDEVVRQIMLKPPYRREPGEWTVECSDRVRPSLYGLVTELDHSRRLEVFRNGHMEFRVPIGASFCREEFESPPGHKHSVLYPYPLAEYPLSFLHSVGALADHVAIMEPTVIGLSILNAGGLALRGGVPGTYHYRVQGIDRVPTWKHDQHLEVPFMQFAYPMQPDQVAKSLADRVWNAFGYEECPVLDEDGELVLEGN
ncbi:MAG: helix-turn-helix domain-containing protein [Armatimonadota bacterium]